MRTFYYINVDLDRTLVDFDKGVLNYSNKSFKEMTTFEKADFWRTVPKDFFLNLEPFDYTKEFFNKICEYGMPVNILTALPYRVLDCSGKEDKELLQKVWRQSISSKTLWVQKVLGHNVPIKFSKTASSKGTHIITKRDVLIDDSTRAVGSWLDSGGLGILHHPKSYLASLAHLEESHNEFVQVLKNGSL